MVQHAGDKKTESNSPRRIYLVLIVGITCLTVALYRSRGPSYEIHMRFAGYEHARSEMDRQRVAVAGALLNADTQDLETVQAAVRRPLTNVQQIIDDLLNGGSSFGRPFLPVQDSQLKDLLSAMRDRTERCVDRVISLSLADGNSEAATVRNECWDWAQRMEELGESFQLRTALLMKQQISKLHKSYLATFAIVVILALCITWLLWRNTKCQKRVEEALRVSEEKYRGLYESSLDAVMLLDDRGFIDCNPAALKHFGMKDKAEFRSKHPAELSPTMQPNGDRSVDMADRLIAEAYRAGTCRFEWMHRRQDGSDFPCEIMLSSLMIGGRQVLQAVARDVTERKEAEEKLRANEEKLRTITDSALDAVIMMDSHGRAAHWNPAAERIFGYSAEEMLGQKIHSILVPPSEQEQAEKSLPQFYQSGNGPMVDQVVELNAVRKGGVEFPIEVSVSPIFMEDAWWAVAVARDISDRKQAEASLRQSHEELRTIYQGVTDGLLIADVKTRRFESANKAICDMLGYTHTELMGLSVDDIHPPESLPKIIDVFSNPSSQLTSNTDLPVRRKDGSVLYADVSSTRIIYHDRECLIGFFRDITERKLTAEALQHEQKSLRRLLKYHDQERQLIAYEIHDGLAQHLVAAIMQCQSLGEFRDSLPQEVDATFQDVLAMLRRALNETRRLISGVRPPILDELGVVSAVRGLIHEMSTGDAPDIEFRANAEFDRIDPAIENSAYRIVQESLNNACRHSRSKRVRVELTRQNDLVRIAVRDWGVGFDTHSVDEQRYGLAGIRERVRLLGGRLRIDSKRGEGTRVLAQLPLIVPEMADAE
jgi:PAS domain S-box-containing protein